MLYLRAKVDWLVPATENIRKCLPEVPGADFGSGYIAERLARVFLQRLPSSHGKLLVELLPSPPDFLAEQMTPEGDTSIGYVHLLESASHSLILNAILDPGQQETVCERLVDVFLETLSYRLPPDVLYVITPDLPAEIRQRLQRRYTREAA